MMRELLQLMIAVLACAAMLASNALELTLHASLVQAAFDVALAFALFLVWRVLSVLARRHVYARDRAERDAEDAKKWREAEEKRWERLVLRKQRRRRRA